MGTRSHEQIRIETIVLREMDDPLTGTKVGLSPSLIIEVGQIQILNMSSPSCWYCSRPCGGVRGRQQASVRGEPRDQDHVWGGRGLICRSWRDLFVLRVW